ncbi:hypothetical protein PXK01_11385 [Phaeobacter sp. PT47_59]|uniref:hypothetical protein n=1 Tax=Phaeobacter sp. PT47_59 TaxID=3029979 RepID=UPI002380276F|nr:hypothetical protein [Phaeobacter sp. PT47_59]MDE4174760.1 hypothetical protein [Phaeobacter sp. PT47_59]
MRPLINLCVSALLALVAGPALSNCIDLTKGSSFNLTREEPRFTVTNTVFDDGTVLEQREIIRSGKVETVITTYWNGVVPVDRKSSSSRVQLKINADVKRSELGKAGKSYSFPVAILVNGNEVDRGTYVIETIRKTYLEIAGCRYSVMVVRKTIDRNNGDPINEEALLSLDAGILLGNVAMTPKWQAKHGVFFDKIEAN